jgi:hypothetical protein
MSNNEKFIGVLLNGGQFDKDVRETMIFYIELAAERVVTKGHPLTRISLSRELEMDRNRVTRITKALGITSIFD